MGDVRYRLSLKGLHNEETLQEVERFVSFLTTSSSRLRHLEVLDTQVNRAAGTFWVEVRGSYELAQQLYWRVAPFYRQHRPRLETL